MHQDGASSCCCRRRFWALGALLVSHPVAPAAAPRHPPEMVSASTLAKRHLFVLKAEETSRLLVSGCFTKIYLSMIRSTMGMMLSLTRAWAALSRTLNSYVTLMRMSAGEVWDSFLEACADTQRTTVVRAQCTGNLVERMHSGKACGLPYDAPCAAMHHACARALRRPALARPL